MPGLAESRWARSSRFPSTQPHQSRPGPESPAEVPDPRHELGRYARIVRRLKWKLPYLAAGYHQAIAREVDRAKAEEAEIMFKLDFFEFYMLIERAVVHLLGVFGVEVSRGFADRHLEALAEEQRTGPNGSRNAPVVPQFSHRYHANVLEALDNPANPLHGSLGTGEARRQLARAKDLRNRWKNAEDGDSKVLGVAAKTGYVPTPLESYDLEKMLTDIFDAFDRAYLTAEAFVLKSNDTKMTTAAISEEEEWDFMVDAMDWESV
ncbi:hypothetical protein GQ53DRAFT_29800 [Thozetella sp. PMI_491]|nr:hypothetical protein GQ53DRAFT_29800 [Thozetella sp. PMI_491]